jgi:hypothetical protein
MLFLTVRVLVINQLHTFLRTSEVYLDFCLNVPGNYIPNHPILGNFDLEALPCEWYLTLRELSKTRQTTHTKLPFLLGYKLLGSLTTPLYIAKTTINSGNFKMNSANFMSKLLSVNSFLMCLLKP